MGASGNMAKSTKKTTRGRNQDRARVAGGQSYEVRFTAKKAKRSASEGGASARTVAIGTIGVDAH